jgi:DNA-binding HxlR family transcriptional regulator
VARRVLTESPVDVEYSFTKLGETLEAPITALYEWTSKHSADVRNAQTFFDTKRGSLKSTTRSGNNIMVRSNR